MYTIFNIKFDIPKQIFFLSYNNDENRDLKKYLSRSSFGLEKHKYFLNKKKRKRVDIDMLDFAKSFPSSNLFILGVFFVLIFFTTINFYHKENLQINI